MVSILKTSAVLSLISTGAEAFQGINSNLFFNRGERFTAKKTVNKPESGLRVSPTDLPDWTIPVELISPVFILVFGALKSAPDGPSKENIPMSMMVFFYEIYFKIVNSVLYKNDFDKQSDETRSFWDQVLTASSITAAYEVFRGATRFGMEQINNGLHPNL